MTMRCLHLGAGTRPHVEAGVDVVANDVMPLPGIDVHDLTVRPWPYRNGDFDIVLAEDILEHLPDFFGAMEEIHDALKAGGVVEIRGPYGGSLNHFSDPTHARGFTELTFMYFDPRHEFSRVFRHYTYARFHLNRMAFETPRGWEDATGVIVPPEGYVQDIGARRAFGNMTVSLIKLKADEEVRVLRERQAAEREARFVSDVESIVARMLARHRRDGGDNR